LISPEWTKPGSEMSIKKAVTEFGRISAKITFSGAGADVTVEPMFKHSPRDLVIPIPYFVEVDSVKGNGSKALLKNAITHGAMQ